MWQKILTLNAVKERKKRKIRFQCYMNSLDVVSQSIGMSKINYK
jgi:hypothetical protein